MAQGPRTFRELAVWRLAMATAIECYRLTDTFPSQERYGLTSQLRRAVVSIPANLAEGHNRRSRRAYLNHVNIALGSQAEAETLLELARRLSFISLADCAGVTDQLGQIGRMLHALSTALANIRDSNANDRASHAT
jgi:four helix bundle protein